MNPDTRVIEATICRGRPTHLAGEAATRLVSGLSQTRLAAE